MATSSRSTSTRSGTIKSFKKLVRRANISHLDDIMSKKLLGVCRATLEYFDLSSDSGDLELPDADEVKLFVKQSLPPPNSLFGEDFFKMPLMPMMVLKDIVDLYGCGTTDSPFVRAVNLTTAEGVSPRITAVVWLPWLMMDSASFTRSFIDQYNAATNVQVGQYSAREATGTGQDPQAQDRSREPASARQVEGEAQATNRGQVPQDPRAHNSQGYNAPTGHGDNGYAPSASQRNSSGNIELQNRGGNIYATIPNTGNSARAPFLGNTRRHMDDNEPRRVSYFQGAVSKGKRFTGDLSESIHTTLQMYELTVQQYDLLPTQMAELFVHTLDGPAQLFYLREIKASDSYPTIKQKMLDEYHSDARQLQVEGNLSQLRLRKLMQEESITDVSKGLSTLVVKIEELVPQWHLEFQTDRHKIRYLCDAVAEFSEWSLGPMENINAQRYSFNRLVTAMHESIQAKAKVKMLQGEATGHSLPAHTHIGQYSRNPRHVRREKMASSSKGRTPRNFHEARRMGLCFKCLGKWEPKHKCKPGAVRENVRDRMESGESLVHLVSCLVDAIEEDEDNQEDEPVTTAHAQVQQHLEEFDSYHAEHDAATSDGDSKASVDEAIVTQLITNATSPYLNTDEKDFLQGDKDNSLNLAAQNQ